MRVIIISQTESFLTRRGQRHPDLAKELLSRGHNVIYISSNYYHAEKRFLSLDEANDTILGSDNLLFKLISVPKYQRNVGLKRLYTNQVFAYRTYKFLRACLAKDDIILVASRPVETLYAISRLKKHIGFRAVMDVRDIWPDALNVGSKIKRNAFTLYCNLFLRGTLKKYDVFLFTAPRFSSWINRYLGEASKNSHFLPLGFSNKRFDVFSLDRPREIESFGRVKIVFIGLLQKQIDLLSFIKVLGKFPSYSLDIYGDDGTGELYEEVYSLIHRLNLDNVKLKGRLSSHLVPVVLGTYDIGLVPMKAKFSIPNKVFDYVALGLPMIVLGTDDVKDFVKKYRIGWIAEFSEESIEKVLSETSLSSESYRTAAHNVFKIKEDYGRDVLFKKLIEDVLKV